MADINIFGKVADIFKRFLKLTAKDEEIPEEIMAQAEEILAEIFEKFLSDISKAETNSALLDTELFTHRTSTSVKGRKVPKVEVEVDGELYNWFDDGYNATFKASDYVVTAPDSPRKGEPLRGFPILVRQSAGTTPNSLNITTVAAKEGIPAKYESAGNVPNRKPGDPVVFRRFVTIDITPRNFTQTIAKEAQKELERRGITGIVIEAIDG